MSAELSKARNGNSLMTNQPYRLPPTVEPMTSDGSLNVQVMSGAPAAFLSVRSTVSTPRPLSRNLCSNVYQPSTLTVYGILSGFFGKAPLRVALLLALITNRGPAPVESASL